MPLSLPNRVTVSLGSGDDVLELTSDVAPLVLGSVSVTAGIGFDRVEISGPAGGTARGALVMSLGDGGSTVALREITLGGSQVAVTTGVGNDSLEIVVLAATRSLVTFAEATSVVLQATASGGRVNATLHGRFEAAKAALTCSAAGQAGTVAVTNDGSLNVASAAMIGTHSFTATSCIFAAKAAVSGGDVDDLFTVGPGVRFPDSLSVRLGNGGTGVNTFDRPRSNFTGLPPTAIVNFPG